MRPWRERGPFWRSHGRSVAEFTQLRPLPHLRPHGKLLLEPQCPKGVPVPCLLPPPTIPGFLESDSWEAYLASVHPSGPRVLLRTTWVSAQPACQSPVLPFQSPRARLLHSSQTYIHLLLRWEHREPASPRHPTLPRPPCPRQHLLPSLHSWHPDRSWFLSDFSSLPDPWACNVCSRNSRLPDPSVLDLSVPAPENLL